MSTFEGAQKQPASPKVLKLSPLSVEDAQKSSIYEGMSISLWTGYRSAVPYLFASYARFAALHVRRYRASREGIS
jgi:hypothetical protein